jgi:hypothetical protein
LDVIDCDVVFITYPSNILGELVEKLQPVHVCTHGYHSQETNANAAIQWMVDNQDRYDRFVLLRFDVMYRKKITDWPHWDKKGITLVNRDAHYPTARLYADIVFVVDAGWAKAFQNAFLTHPRVCLHHIGRNLETVEGFRLMHNGYYHMTTHPLHAIHPIEPEPNLEEDYPGMEILDVSPWN